MKYPLSLSIIFSILILFSCSEKKTDENYANEINEWHKHRIERLKADDGWLNLAGLFWLKDGKNSFGSAGDNDIVFPGSNIPANIGYFILNDSAVTMRINNGIIVKADDKPVSELILNDDISGKKQVMSLENLRWFLINRSGKMGIRLRDLNAELVKNFKGIERFPVDDNYRVTAKFIEYPTPKTVEVPTILGTVETDTSYGKLKFNLDGKNLSLEPLGKERLFVIFADETNGIETYGAGRFLYTDGPDSSGNVILDFNKAYNPPCAFTKYATCPLPLKENYLKVKIESGEKKYGDH